MKVLYFSRDYTTHDHRFLASLVGNGYRVFYLRLEKRGHALESRMLPKGVTLVPWAGGKEPFDRENFRPLLDGLRKVIREIRPDLIHAGPVQTCAWLAAQTRFHPLVTMSWGSDMLVDADASRQMQRLTEFTLANTDLFVGDCDAVRQKAISFGFPEERIVTFPWGIDLTRFSPGEGGDALRQQAGWEDAFVLMHTRSWEPVYGVDVLAKAFVQAAGQAPKLRLFLLGDGSLAPEIRDLLAPVIERVVLAGQVPQEQLPDYYRAADLYISASYSDGSSVSLMEALASGLPALVSDIPGNREWIEGSGAGWLFPDGDTGALAQGILDAYRQKEQLTQMRRAARQLAEARANWEKNFEKLVLAYDFIITKNKGR